MSMKGHNTHGTCADSICLLFKYVELVIYTTRNIYKYLKTKFFHHLIQLLEAHKHRCKFEGN